MKKDIWEGRIGENANKESLGSYYRSQEDVCTTKGKDLPIVKE